MRSHPAPRIVFGRKQIQHVARAAIEQRGGVAPILR